MTDSKKSRRVPWVAVALSFLTAGVGHLYCGQIRKALWLYFAWWSLPVGCLIAALLGPSTSVLVGCLLIPAFAVAALYLYAAIDSYRVAAETRREYQLKDYNRMGIYSLLILVHLLFPVALTFGAREFLYEAFYIPSRSMSPSVVPGDRILVNKVRPRKKFPQRGDVVVFRNPDPQGARFFIKRVVAVAGDKISVDGSQVIINGHPLERDPLPVESLDSVRGLIEGDGFYEENAGLRYKVLYGDRPADDASLDMEEITIPPRNVFVMGDNRNRSRDSRHFGPIHVGDVSGYVDYLYYPAGSWSRFGAYQD